MSKKDLIWIFLNLPALVMLIALGYNPKLHKVIVEYSAYSGLGLIILVLLLNPLQNMLPNFKIIKNINKHRRVIGVASFSYITVHFICFIIKRGSLKATIPYLVFNPAITPAFISWIILLLLAITSNNYFIKKMKYDKWKNLHKKIYILEVLVFIHMYMVKEVFWAIVLLTPLIIIQLLKKYKYSKTNTL